MVTTAVAVLVAVATTSCAPDAVTAQGREVEGLYRVFLYVAAVVFTVTAGLIGWSLIRYRERPGGPPPEQFHSNFKLELVWFAIPQAIVVVLFVLSTMTLGRTTEPAPPTALTIGVTGYQWGWSFDYPEHSVRLKGTPQSPARVVVPTGHLRFELESADVVHSFYVPRFLTKKDTIPGRTVTLNVTTEEEGTYGGVCAEFCGLLHDRMTFTIEVVSPAEFEAWVSSEASR